MSLAWSFLCCLGQLRWEWKTKSSLVVFWTDPSCGGVFYLTNRGVEVTSPNYPDLHPPDITCQYVFKVSKLLNLVTPEHLCQLYFKGAVNNSCLQNIFAFLWQSLVGNERTALSEERHYLSWNVLYVFNYNFISKKQFWKFIQMHKCTCGRMYINAI